MAIGINLEGLFSPAHPSKGAGLLNTVQELSNLYMCIYTHKYIFQWLAAAMGRLASLSLGSTLVPSVTRRSESTASRRQVRKSGRYGGKRSQASLARGWEWRDGLREVIEAGEVLNGRALVTLPPKRYEHVAITRLQISQHGV